jgi:hypothetical protein
MSEIGSQMLQGKLTAALPARGIRSAGYQRLEVDDLRMNGDGFRIIRPSMAPISRFVCLSRSCSGVGKYPQLCANPSHVSVSPFSPSASVSLLMKCASYLRFAHASRRVAPTDRDDRRIWSVREYLSSAGKVLVDTKTYTASSYAVL